MEDEEPIQCSKGGGEAFEWKLDFMFQRNSIPFQEHKTRWNGLLSNREHIEFLEKYLNSGFDLSSFLKMDNSNEFSSSCTTRIVPILTTGVSFLRSYKVSNKRPIMGHPRSDLGCPRSVLVGPGQSQDGPGLSQASPSMARLIWV